jgi:error-prone DNA polymerase
VVVGLDAPPLPGMTEVEEVAADLWATGMSAARHPTELVREELAARGVVTAGDLRELPDRSVVDIAGVVTHRQQPETAKGIVFVNLEDETGLVNVICTKGVWKRFRVVAHRTGARDPRCARALPGCGQRARAADRGAAAQPRRPVEVPRLPLTSSAAGAASR